MITSSALQRLESLGIRGMKLGLAAIDSICDRLGRPEGRVPSVLIAGTNGKGSTAATLSALARACGVRAGLYTSPHLVRVSERIRVADEDISEEGLETALAEVFRVADDPPEVRLTYFEALTAAAFHHFAESGLDLAILEVGLGGRFDATNIAPAELSVVTSIALDHTEELGPTLVSIAREKAGVFRRGRPALARANDPAVLEMLRDRARVEGALFHDAEAELKVEPARTGLDETVFWLTTPERRVRLATPLPGSHQAWNTALAVRAAELLGLPGRGLTPDALDRGVRAVRWAGRLEKFEIAGRVVFLDGCHNPDAAEALARFLDDSSLSGRFHLIFGAMADKDVEAMARVLFPRAAGVTLVTAPSDRAATAEELSRRTAAFREDAVTEPRVTRALARLLADGGEEPIIVAGSLYLVGEARVALLAGGLSERGSAD